VLQALYILIGAYSFNEYMIETAKIEEGCRNIVMLLYTLILTAGSWFLLIGSFNWFQGPPTELDANGQEITTILSCGKNQTLIVVTLIMNVLVCGLRLRPDSSIFTSAMVNLWLTYLMWSALASSPDECNTLISSGATSFW